jgi:hypothetical protein
MINSKMVSDLLQLLLEDDAEGQTYFLQLPYLSISNVNYTGSGVFFQFSHIPTIEIYKTDEEYNHFCAVRISSEELTAEAEAIVYVKNGILDYLEVWSFDGNYPERELGSYKAWQAWKGSPGKFVINS